MGASLHERFSEQNSVTIQIDHDICAGFGDCVSVAPDVFALNEDDLATILDPDGDDMDALKEAANSCPVSAILLFDDKGQQLAPDV